MIRRLLILPILVLRLPLAWAEESLTLEIFTDAAHPVATAALTEQGVAFSYYELDAPARWAAALSRDLPADAAQAKRLLQARLARLSPATLTQNWQGLARARHYGLDRLPAVVCAGQGIVYGVSDGAVALTHCQRWRQGNRP